MDLNVTRVGATPTYGYGLFATSDLNRGDVILSICNPSLLTVENQALNIVCGFCFAEAGDDVQLHPCSQCGIMKFCSDVCQAAALSPEGSHHRECFCLRQLQDSRDQSGVPDGITPTVVRATIQLLSRQVSASTPYDPEITELATHQDQIKQNKSKWEDIQLQARASASFSKTDKRFDLAVELLCRLSTNAFRVESNLGNGPIGLCLDPVLARANHSCRPNAAITFNGRCATLRALFPIAKDEQIFISYIDESQRGEVRRAALKESWFFTCDCARCTEPSLASSYRNFLESPVVYPASLDTLIPYNETKKFSEKVLREAVPTDILRLYSSLHVIRHIEHLNANPPTLPVGPALNRRLEALKANISSLNDFLLIHRFIQPFPTLLNEVYLIYLQKADYMSALIILLFLIIYLDPVEYPSPYHPQRATRLLALYKLLKLDIFDTNTIAQYTEDHDMPSSIFAEVDWFVARCMVLNAVKEVGAKCWGSESRLMVELERDVGDMKAILKQMPGKNGIAGMDLRKTGRNLKRVAGYVFDLVGLVSADYGLFDFWAMDNWGRAEREEMR
ncbi:SET domain protein [Rutstroemia sp. NJR-2017a BBW]|nr:SET domain protein [Rutstroemia sp. NJR-2017a BBW]